MKKQNKINKVALTYPNQRWQKDDLTTTWNLNPYTLCLLASMIKEDVEVKIIDAQFYDMSKEKFKKEIESYKPDLVGISLLCTEYASIGDIATEIIKEINPNIITLLGGAHVTCQYSQVMKNKNIDYAIRGEGEYVLRNFIRYLNGQEEFPKKGMVYRKSDGDLEALTMEFIENLDSLPYPSYEFIDFDKYGTKIQRYGLDAPPELPFIRIPTARGCPIGCSFCQVENISGKKQRIRSAKNIIDELEILIKKYGIKSIVFDDDNTFLNKTRSKEMLGMMIEKNLNLKWKANGVGLFTLDEEIIDLMAKSGCLMINIAIESGNERVLKNIIRKPIDLKTAPYKIEQIKKRGIYTCANFIIGSPGETWNEIRESLYYAETCGADYVKIFIANPLQGTKMYEMAKKENYIVGDENIIDWRYGRIKTPEFTPKDISILRAYEWDRINFTDPEKRKKTAKMMNISLEELDKIRKETRDLLKFE